MSSRKSAPPLLARPGATFTCHGDGLCCTDVHQLGPVTRGEKVALDAHAPGSVTRIAGLVLLRLADDEGARPGGCHFLDAEIGCRIHAHDARPRTCHRFPYLLTRTPDGLRVGTDHRCPCRTLGERGPLDVERAHDALVDRGGRASTDRDIDGRIPIAPRRHVGWKRYRALEETLLAELATASASRTVESILSVEPFPPIEIGTWEQIGVDLAQEPRPSRWGECFRMFGRTLAWLHCPPDERPRRLRFSPRMWSESFDRAERRAQFDPAREGDVIEAMYADFVADFVWGLEWTYVCDLGQLRVELASRLAVARTFARALVNDGARPDRACAESIAMIEVVGVSPAWMSIAGRFSLAP